MAVIRRPFPGLALGLALVLFFALPLPCRALQEFITVKDQRGVDVRVPRTINRVVTISDGMIEGVMTRLKVADKIVGLGSGCIPKIWSYTYPTLGSETYDYHDGMNPVTYLNPGFMDLPLVSRSGTGINYEKLASLDPDVVIVRTGSCSLRGGDDVMDKGIRLIESLGIPLVVLHGPNTFDRPDLGSMGEEIRIIGRVFQQSERADTLAAFLEQSIAFVRERTGDIKVAEKKEILLLGLSPKARSQGGAGHAKGQDTIQTHLLQTYVNADNAYKGSGAWGILNTEQLLALDPDVIILVTAWGYHPPRELYEAPYYQGLTEMTAVQNRAVSALPWTPCNCEKRLEYPIDVMVMAKAAYPERFQDIDLGDWLLTFYQNLYGVDQNTAKELRACQWMEWTLKE
ncbi:MAG: ABC transporter substrate-binding protein [Desulfobacterium sp.]|nr:ABC transporter substrate-binding protein [Desulfobacterium sp.]